MKAVDILQAVATMSEEDLASVDTLHLTHKQSLARNVFTIIERLAEPPYTDGRNRDSKIECKRIVELWGETFGEGHRPYLPLV